MVKQQKTSKKDSKPRIKVRDLKLSKDAKGGVSLRPIVVTKPIDKGNP
jgi:hypothetical protein